jgi:hypothetical protein
MVKIVGRATRKVTAREREVMKQLLEDQGVEFINAPMGEGKADIMSDDADEVIKALFDDTLVVKK